jgi:hypothetical protein
MAFVRTSRCLRACLLAIFMVAQVAGIVPLVYGYTINALEQSPVAGHSHDHVHGSLVSADSDHHHGAVELHDQCCALHVLAGPIPEGGDAGPIDFRGVRMAPSGAIRLTGRDPPGFDRPPRSLPLI